MPYSSESFNGVAAVQEYVFGEGLDSLTDGLKFLSSAHLTVFVDGASVAFTVAEDQGSFTITGAVIAGGELIEVDRETPATEDGRRVDFEDLSHVRQADLDLSSLQLLYIAQESLDSVAAGTCLDLGVSGHWDAELLKIENVADGVDDADAVNKGQLDLVAISNGNLPVVTAADNDKSLAVVAGAWAVRTPAQMRVHYGLGTAALLDAGTGALQVPQFDGSARYPANDGRNIDLTLNPIMDEINLRYRTTVGFLANAVEQTPLNSASGTWYESGSSILTLGSLVDLDNDSDVSVASNVITLSAGTWEIQWTLRAYNQNTTAGNDQTLRVRLADDENSGAQVLYDDNYDRTDIEAAGSTNKAFWTLGNTVLLLLPAGGTVTLRAANETSTDIRIPSVSITCRKVSTDT